MKIILLQDVKNLGKKGDVKEVAKGYVQNFLLPKKLAEIATENLVKAFETQKAKEEKERKAQIQEFENLAQNLKNRKITILAPQKKGKLFGSIKVKDIAAALQKEDLNISENSIIIKQAIKNIGEYEVEIKLAQGIEAKIIIEVKSAQ
jgi:large subunit ribosomal protein L9